FNGDFDPNSSLSSYNGMGGSHGMYFAADAGGGQAGSGSGSGGSVDALIDKMYGLGGSWSNTGASFTSSENINLGYDGSYLSLNTALDVVLQEVVMTGRVGNKGYNSLLLSSKISGALNSWNYDVNSANLGWGIAHSKASQGVAEFEQFLFIDVPLSFAGEGLIAAGWRAGNFSRYLCGPMGKITNGLIKICFAEGTLVSVENGNKKIEDI
ncbi:hypothetical protein ABEG63_21515, partial [Chryseobacterium sp. C39-AII1]|uniref:hypothetical protein n=1 Tax=Chryseobacterium sp. C39-AII1 TaxID=3080332 RepID=UPI0032086C50